VISYVGKPLCISDYRYPGKQRRPYYAFTLKEKFSTTIPDASQYLLAYIPVYFETTSN